MRTTERAKPAPAPAPAPVAAAVAKPAAPPPPPPKTATSRSQRVAVTSTGSLPQRIATSAQPEDAYQRELQSRMVNWHPIEMSFHLLTTASWNSASGRGSAALTDDFGGGLRTTVGPNIDFYFFRDRYAFGTGLWYTIKRMGYTQPPDRLLTPTTPSRTAAFNLQYLQIPITMKLVSNTLFRSGRSFIQYGGTLDFKLAETPIDYQNNYVYQRDGNVAQFTSAGLSLLLAVGYMHRVSRTNDLIMTVQYQRSLTNNAIPENLWAISQHLGFGIGLSF
ncbi:MAG: PorT family protein [Cytophagales bacterium]|nr:MAG: PorT family protein [Cytophagales bacterium]